MKKGIVRILADLFPPGERWLLVGVLVMGLFAAFFETLGVVSILPFMALALDPAAMERYPALSSIARFFGATSDKEALVLMGAATVVLVALGNAAAAGNVFVTERFAARTFVRLAAGLFAGYLRQPYRFHVQRDAPSLLKVLLSDVRIVIGFVIRPLLGALSKSFMAIGMISLLFSHNPAIALTVAVVLGGAYGVVFRVFRARQRRFGAELNIHSLDRHRVSQEALGGVKDLQMLGREEYVIDRFEAASLAAARAETSTHMTAALPRFVLEALTFGGIVLISLLLLAGAHQNASSALPVLALFAFAGYRLLPALQQIFTAAVSIRFYQSVLRDFAEDFAAVAAASPAPLETEEAPDLHFTDAIRLEQLSFTYVGGSGPSLQAVDLVIRPKESIGLVGRTGAGKTTLADLILGLYEPTAGRLTVDGVPLTGRAIRAWRKRVGYVPQQVFLANASVAENIAFALPPHEIDHDAVRRAANLAQAQAFIDMLPQGFETLVGERGVKLSGGQRQRIGIARALYHDPEVLVFDEATSALDGLTEDAVMEEIRSLSGARTIILIAHRLRTVEACDRIVLIEGGRIRADGHYDELLDTCEEFRRLAGKEHAVNDRLSAES